MGYDSRQKNNRRGRHTVKGITTKHHVKEQSEGVAFFILKNLIKEENKMAVQLAGLSSLKIKFGYGVETTAGTKPAAFKWLERCNNISGIELPVETIDRI